MKTLTLITLLFAQLLISLLWFTYRGAPLYTGAFYLSIVVGAGLLYAIGYCLKRAVEV